MYSICRFDFETPKTHFGSCLVKHIGVWFWFWTHSLYDSPNIGILYLRMIGMGNEVNWQCEHSEIHCHLARKWLGSCYLNVSCWRIEVIQSAKRVPNCSSPWTEFKGTEFTWNGGWMVTKWLIKVSRPLSLRMAHVAMHSIKLSTMNN